MTQYESVSQPDTDPALLERLPYRLTDPIYLNPSDLNGLIAPPTPLDPENVYVRAMDKQVADWSEPVSLVYSDYAVKSAVLNATLHIESLGKDGPILEYLKAETILQLINRMNHNNEAFKRLMLAIAERPASPNDGTLLHIVYKARCGMASLPEMVRLIKEYPEMVSIETSSFYATAGGPEGYDPIKAAYQAAGSLVANFHDAEVTLGSAGTAPTVKASTLVPGSETRKRVLATISSVDSCTEMVLKESFITVNEREWLLGVSTYLRTADRQSRPGYVADDALPESLFDDNMPAEQARQLLGRLASGNL